MFGSVSGTRRDVRFSFRHMEGCSVQFQAHGGAGQKPARKCQAHNGTDSQGQRQRENVGSMRVDGSEASEKIRKLEVVPQGPRNVLG